ncbi:MAG TPA: LysE family translocator, partial [Caulobacteraceae bacterium]
AALGLSALVVAFPAQFRFVAVLGALYVAWLGLQSILGALKDRGASGHAPVRMGRSAFLDGFAVQISNPKIILFFAGVLPPFLDLDRPIPAQLALFACGTIGFDVLAMSAYGLGGAALSARMTKPRFRRGFGIVVGVLLLTTAALILTRH